MKARVLIIDRDPVTRQSLSARLRQTGFDVEETAFLIEAHRLVQSRRVDVVILGLPGLKNEALDLLRYIKYSRPAIEIILLTDMEHIHMSIQGMKMGAFDDLLVPFDVDSLVSAVTAAYRKARKKPPASVSGTRGVPLQDFLQAVGLGGVRASFGVASL